MTGWRRRFLMQLVLTLALLALAIRLLTAFVVHPWTVSGSSMRPTLAPGDRVLVDLWSYRSRDPRVGEIVLIDGSGEQPQGLIKRVTARSAARDPRPRAELWPGADGESGVWVQGDNSGQSLDSRAFGPVPRARIRGRVVWRYWPPSRSGRVR